jgi:hypothetical protein
MRLLEIKFGTSPGAQITIDIDQMKDGDMKSHSAPKGDTINIMRRPSSLSATRDIDLNIQGVGSDGTVRTVQYNFPYSSKHEEIEMRTPGGGINTNSGSIEYTDVVNTMNERMYFLEELMDLYVMEHITKDRYLQLRNLFKTEERKFAIKTVRELHRVHILTNVPLTEIT